MLPEDRFICLLARQRIEDRHIERLTELCRTSALNWDYIFATAHAHQISPLILANLQTLAEEHLATLPIPSHTQDNFKQAYIHNVLVKKQTSHVLMEALDILERFDLAVMLVKGEALNLTVYEHPWYTISYDIDLVIRARRSDLSPGVLIELDDAFHGLNSTRGLLREHLEYDFYSHHDVTMNDILPFDMERIWREADCRRIGDHTVMLMRPEETLLAAAVQCCRKRYFRLKAICDVAEIVSVYPDLNWSELIARAQAYRCNVMLYSALYVAGLLLGAEVEGEVLHSLGVNPGRQRVIERIAGSLVERESLAELHERSQAALFGRQFSWSLALTYATYRFDQLPLKAQEVIRGGRLEESSYTLQ